MSLLPSAFAKHAGTASSTPSSSRPARFFADSANTRPTVGVRLSESLKRFEFTPAANVIAVVDLNGHVVDRDQRSAPLTPLFEQNGGAGGRAPIAEPPGTTLV